MVIRKSKRSGGPKTLEGKAASSKNAVKTGSYSSQIALSSEEEADFKVFEDEFMNDFEPLGVVESSMVHELTVLAWKKLRLERVEHQMMRDQLKAPITPQEYIDAGFGREGDLSFAMNRLEQLTTQFVKLHEDELRLARSLKDRRDETVLETLDLDRPDFYARLHKAVKSFKRAGIQVVFVKTGIDEDRDAKIKKTFADTSIADLNEALDQIIQESGAVLHISKNIELIQGLKSKILDKRLMGMMESTTSHRVHEDLGRLFSRRLKELREQQSWRLKRDIIDVLSEEE
ncbi:MAG: hypothetical protein NTY92_01485 [Nitrosospira sp.]|nr:hypothetical protein [Nitrosospira sp.]